MKYMILVMIFLATNAVAQRDEWCGNEVIQIVNKEELIICYRFDLATCFRRDPAATPDLAPELAGVDADRPLGYPNGGGISFAQTQRYWAQQGCRSAMKDGDMETAFTYSLDMIYWQTRMAMAGAYGVEMAAPWGDDVEAVFRGIVAGARNEAFLQSLYGLPNYEY